MQWDFCIMHQNFVMRLQDLAISVAGHASNRLSHWHLGGSPRSGIGSARGLQRYQWLMTVRAGNQQPSRI